MAKDFFAHGYTPAFRHQEIITANSTITVWTPESGNRIVLDGLTVGSGPGGTIQFFLHNNLKVAEFFAAASITIAPTFGQIESTLASQALLAVASNATSGGWRITATGFEI